MTRLAPLVDVTMTVKDLANRVPGTREVFARLSIDTCCGGNIAIADAARHHGIDLESLVAELGAALTSSSP